MYFQPGSKTYLFLYKKNIVILGKMALDYDVHGCYAYSVDYKELSELIKV